MPSFLLCGKDSKQQIYNRHLFKKLIIIVTLFHWQVRKLESWHILGSPHARPYHMDLGLKLHSIIKSALCMPASRDLKPSWRTGLQSVHTKLVKQIISVHTKVNSVITTDPESSLVDPNSSPTQVNCGFSWDMMYGNIRPTSGFKVQAHMATWLPSHQLNLL